MLLLCNKFRKKYLNILDNSTENAQIDLNFELLTEFYVKGEFQKSLQMKLLILDGLFNDTVMHHCTKKHMSSEPR